MVVVVVVVVVCVCVVVVVVVPFPPQSAKRDGSTDPSERTKFVFCACASRTPVDSQSDVDGVQEGAAVCVVGKSGSSDAR